MQKKRKYAIILLNMLLIQIIWWAIFTTSNESLARLPWEQRADNHILQFMLLISNMMPLLIFVLYICNERKIKEKLQLKNFKYNAFIVGSWIIITIISTILVMSIGKNRIGYCNPSLEPHSSMFGPCFLSGIEYCIMPLLMILPAIALIILKFIIWIYKMITKKLKSSYKA